MGGELEQNTDASKLPYYLLYLTHGCRDMSSMMLMLEKESRTSGARPESLLLQRISPWTWVIVTTKTNGGQGSAHAAAGKQAVGVYDAVNEVYDVHVDAAEGVGDCEGEG